MKMFSQSIVTLGPNQYRLIIAPLGYMFLSNATFTVTTKDQPTVIDVSANNVPFRASNYKMNASLNWFLINSPDMSDL